MKKIAIAVLVGLAWTAPAVAAPCQGYELSAQQTSGESYNPAALTPERVRLKLTAFDSDLPNGCVSAAVEVRSADRGPIKLHGPGGILTAQFVRSNVIGQMTTSTVNINGNGRGDIVRDQQLEFDFLELDAGQFVAPGIYTADVEAVAGDGNAALLQVRVTVEPAMRFVSVVPGTVTNISLGEVTAGASAQSGFLLKTNANLAIVARSQNKGTLLHNLGQAFGAIPYRAYLAGSELDLQQEVAARLSVAPTVLRSETLRVVVAPQSEQYAGKYEDTLTLEFTAY